jgi:hypothetical protein
MSKESTKKHFFIDRESQTFFLLEGKRERDRLAFFGAERGRKTYLCFSHRDRKIEREIDFFSRR